MLKKILYALYPTKCMFCGDILSYGSKEYVCHKCMEEYRHISGNVCEKCGRSIPVNSICSSCRGKKIYYDKCFCVYEYRDYVKAFISKMKFNSVKQNCFIAVKQMEEFTKSNDIPRCDYVVPVPMDFVHYMLRGYNQSELMAKYISRLKFGTYCNALYKRRITKPQHKLSGKERSNNLKNSFDIKSNVKDKTILLIDDVFTTGTTVNECSKVLKKSGAKAIYVFCFSVVGDD